MISFHSIKSPRISVPDGPEHAQCIGAIFLKVGVRRPRAAEGKCFYQGARPYNQKGDVHHLRASEVIVSAELTGEIFFRSFKIGRDAIAETSLRISIGNLRDRMELLSGVEFGAPPP